MSSGQLGKPPFRVAVSVADEEGGLGGRADPADPVRDPGPADQRRHALWVHEAIPDLRGVRVLGSDGAQVGADLFRS